MALEELTYVCIDAYHGGRKKNRGRNIIDIMWNSTQSPAPGRGLMQFGKPVLVTEYGGNWDAGPVPQLLAEHASAPWAALAGHAGSPMLWWFEWVDQNNLWAPYNALARFTAGEDLRGADKSGHEFRTSRNDVRATAWGNVERSIGYIVNKNWSYDGSQSDQEVVVNLRLPSEIAGEVPGKLEIEWWNPDLGLRVGEQTIPHYGGTVDLTTPPFKRHLAIKIKRTTSL